MSYMKLHLLKSQNVLQDEAVYWSIADAEVINEFDGGLYFALVQKMTVYDGGRMVVSLRS
jgi:hypothetical protein